MDRTIVVTGASDGLGAAAAARLNRNGENIVVVGRLSPSNFGTAAST